ncbi:MAG: hypothetical protein IJS90_02960 [Clostridia bacterium]|nr:hypothetical protein [Clostridia bacterium]
MKATLMILGTTASEQTATFEEILKKTFGPVMKKDGTVDYFPTLKEATGAIGKAFSDSDTILFFSDIHKYAETKEILCKALGLELTVDEALLSGALRSSSDEQQEELSFNVCHAGVAAGGDVFSLTDCLYSGFAVKRGRQTVMLLPFEESRTTALVGNLVIPYMNERMGTELSSAALQYFYGEKLWASVKREKIKIAIAGTRASEIFMKYVSFSRELTNRILLVNKAENRGNMPPNEYVVNLSITAAEFMGVPYGIAMSNAYYSGDDPSSVKTVYITVTNDAETTVREIRSFYGESTGEFLFRCCSEQCRLLSEVIDADAGLIKREAPEEKKPARTGKYKALIAVLVALILLVCAGGGYYFHSHSYTLKNWVNSYLPFLSASEESGSSADGEASNGEASTEAPGGNTSEEDATNG